MATNLKSIFEFISLNPTKTALLATSVLTGAYFFYFTLKLYILKRKYHHIPGPMPKTNW